MTSTRVVSIALILLGSGVACHTELHAEPLAIDEPVSALYVDVGSGDVQVVGADVTGVTVLAKIEGASNHLAHSLSDGRLSLFEDCNEDPCSVNIEARVPAGAPLEVHTGSGDVRVHGALAAVLLEAGSGDIEGTDIAGLDLNVETGSGDIDLRVFAPAERLHVRAGSGDVKLAVPAGSYRLDVSTGSGDESVQGVSNDAAASGTIAVDTGSGDVRIRGR